MNQTTKTNNNVIKKSPDSRETDLRTPSLNQQQALII